MLDNLCRVLSSEARADDEVPVPLQGGDGAGGGIFEPRHCDACDATVTVVMVEDFPSLLFCRASFSRLGRLVLEVNWVPEPRPDIDIAVERDPWPSMSDIVNYFGETYLRLLVHAACIGLFILIINGKALELRLDGSDGHDI